VVSLRAGLALLATAATIALLAPWLTPIDPTLPIDPAAAKLLPPGAGLLVFQRPGQGLIAGDHAERTGPSAWNLWRRGAVESVQSTDPPRSLRFLLGTDRLGRDVASRVLYGARTTLLVALAAALLSLLLGTAAGAAAGLAPRWLDSLTMRWVDGLLAFPGFLLALLLAVFLTPSLWSAIGILGATAWMGLARMVRGEVKSLRERDFILAARAAGIHPARIFVRHMLPNLTSLLATETSLRLSQLVLAEAALSFFGFGVQPPAPSWGSMLAEGRGDLGVAWWSVVFPGLAISVTALGFALLADGLRDRFDPRRAGAASWAGSARRGNRALNAAR